jgi:hypothetical protein
VLHARRKRITEAARAAARGEPWIYAFSKAVRTKVWISLQSSTTPGFQDTLIRNARDRILHEEGRFYLTDPEVEAVDDLYQYLFKAPHTMVPTVIEALGFELRRQARQSGFVATFYRPGEFERDIQTILREYRIGFDFVEGEMVSFESKELYRDVIERGLRLLSQREGFVSVEAAYRDALRELAGGKAADAITDAGTALQEMLVAMGCQGNALGPLLSSARKRHLLGPHDYVLTEVISKAIDWASADRSQMGDSHKASSATPEDAWLTVHIVGALIVRLAAGPRTSATNPQAPASRAGPT